MAALKVYGMNKTMAPTYKTHRVIVAAPSKAAAARALGVTSSRLTKWGSVTGNANELEVALAAPGFVFMQADVTGAQFELVRP